MKSPIRLGVFTKSNEAQVTVTDATVNTSTRQTLSKLQSTHYEPRRGGKERVGDIMIVSCRVNVPSCPHRPTVPETQHELEFAR